jgi:hypothetical protein
MIIRLALFCICWPLYTLDASAQDQFADPSTSKPGLVFYAMGDVPYTPPQEDILREQIASLPTDGEFVIHVGDIKAGATACDESVYTTVSGILGECKTPLFIIPGDNEWNDCADPAQGWQYWNQYFMRFDQRWHHRLRVFRQLEREENFSFVSGNVLFVGINLVGGLVHDAEEWRNRHRQNLKWVQRNIRQFGSDVSSLIVFGHATPAQKHQDFFEPFCQIAEEFQKPILYLHGDGHKWIEDYPFSAPNILRIQVDQGGIAPPLKVTVTGDPQLPFKFDRRQ